MRRQLKRDFRKPLINMSPKSLLRHPLCVSDIDDFKTGNKFQEVIDDPKASASKVKRVLYCSGKVYYDLLARQTEDKRDDVAIVRIEQLYPFPQKQFDAVVKKYKGAESLWIQEEPLNMGAWDFMLRYVRKMDIEPVARKASASPSTGFKKVHEKQQKEIVDKAFG
jgi:2-oxoglutarate dehydrogenase E1 component